MQESDRCTTARPIFDLAGLGPGRARIIAEIAAALDLAAELGFAAHHARRPGADRYGQHKAFLLRDQVQILGAYRNLFFNLWHLEVNF